MFRLIDEGGFYPPPSKMMRLRKKEELKPAEQAL